MRVEQRHDWSLAQRGLHGWTAFLVLAAIVVALAMVDVPLTALLLKFLLYQLHKSLGITVLLLTVARLAVRAHRGRPASDQALAPWRKHAAACVHAMLYGLLLAVPVLGYCTAATAPADIPTLFLGIIPVPHVLAPDQVLFTQIRFAHRLAAVLLVVLAAGHALAALDNHLHGRMRLGTMWRR